MVFWDGYLSVCVLDESVGGTYERARRYLASNLRILGSGTDGRMVG